MLNKIEDKKSQISIERFDIIKNEHRIERKIDQSIHTKKLKTFKRKDQNTKNRRTKNIY